MLCLPAYPCIRMFLVCVSLCVSMCTSASLFVHLFVHTCTTCCTSQFITKKRSTTHVAEIEHMAIQVNAHLWMCSFKVTYLRCTSKKMCGASESYTHTHGFLVDDQHHRRLRVYRTIHMRLPYRSSSPFTHTCKKVCTQHLGENAYGERVDRSRI